MRTWCHEHDGMVTKCDECGGKHTMLDLHYVRLDGGMKCICTRCVTVLRTFPAKTVIQGKGFIMIREEEGHRIMQVRA